MAQIVALQQLGQGTMLAMDWRRVRETLRDLRNELKIDVADLAKDARVAKTTVYRIEDVAGEPDRTLDLLTLEKLTSAMDVPLSQFFARLEGVVLATETEESGLDPEAHDLAMDLAVALSKHLRAQRPTESQPEYPRAADTKSGSDPRQRSGPRKTGT